MKLGKHVETATNVVVLIVALVLVWVLTARYLIPDFMRSRSSAAAVSAGDKLADIPGFKWLDSPQTLVMALALKLGAVNSQKLRKTKFSKSLGPPTSPINAVMIG